MHVPAVPVMQSRSELLPGLPMSFGPEMNQKRTWLEVPLDGAPSSSNTRAVRVTVPPTGPVPCSGWTSRDVGIPAAMTTGAMNGVAGAIERAQRAAETSAANSAVRECFDRSLCGPTLAYLPMTAPCHLTQATVPRRAPQTRPRDPPSRREKVVASVRGPEQDGSALHRCSHASPAGALPEGPGPLWGCEQSGRLRWGVREKGPRGPEPQRSVRLACASRRASASGRSVRPKPRRK